jgi:YegS/Rv2252/BmrU family lipid kinase
MKKPEKPANVSLRILFILNRRSGNRNLNDLIKIIEQKSKSHPFEYSTYFLDTFSSDLIRKEIFNYKPNIVAVAGGDGSINLIATILAGTKIPLGIIPFGSANGMAKDLEIPVDIKESIEILLTGSINKIDMIKINDRNCLHLADIGLNARVVNRFEKDIKRGLLTYAKHLIGEMLFLKNYVFHIVYDGKKIRKKGVSITFANASKYGTGAVINPEGQLDDGKFEIVLVKPFPRIKLFSIAWKMFSNKLHTSDYVEIFSCKKAVVYSNKKTTLQIDGEVIGKVKEIRLESQEKVLNIIVPHYHSIKHS